MSRDRDLTTVFAGEAKRALAVLVDKDASPSAKVNALDDLDQASMLLSDARFRTRALSIGARLRAAAGRDRQRVDKQATTELGELVAELDASITSAARAKPRVASARRFDTEESRTLRSFFRDEAHQNLEIVIRRLLELGNDGPSGPVLDELLRVTHLLKGSSATVGMPRFAAAAHDLEEVLARVGRRELRWSAELADATVELIDGLLIYVDEAIGASPEIDVQSAELELRVAMLNKLAAAEPVTEFDRTHPGGGFETREDINITARPSARDGRANSAPQVLRVDPRRIDRLMDSVGELTFDRTRIERRIHEIEILSQNLSHAGRVLRDSIEELASDQALSDDLVVVASQLYELEADIANQVAAMRKNSSNLLEDAQALRQTTAELQKGLTGIRMQSATTLFERLAPRVRAMARAEGKRVHLRMLGGDTEFDKAVAEQVADALIQLLRNSVAHGIETSEKRLARGKPETGLITLSARGEGESVAIEVSDDGGGLDTPALRNRLIELGVWQKNRADTESDDDVQRAIFFPGVSSRSSADLLAGRGVGLGAVRETVARLGGEVRVSSSLGHGTTFTVRLPLTTAVAHALLFKVAGNVFAVPNVNVVETALVEASGPAMPLELRSRGVGVPLVSLQDLLGGSVPDARSVPAVVIEYLGRRLAITCDKIVGPREIVVKSLGPLLASIPLYAGGTVSGSGKVQLILDPAALVRLAYPSAQITPRAGTNHCQPRGHSDSDQSLRVLVVDDSRTVRETVTRALERQGYVVDVAPDGAAAWEKLCSVTYDVLITDIEMPELDGFGLLQRVRAGSLAELPVLIISSRCSEENRRRAAELGVIDFLAKPVSLSALERGLSKL